MREKHSLTCIFIETLISICFCGKQAMKSRKQKIKIHFNPIQTSENEMLRCGKRLLAFLVLPSLCLGLPQNAVEYKDLLQIQILQILYHPVVTQGKEEERHSEDGNRIVKRGEAQMGTTDPGQLWRNPAGYCFQESLPSLQSCFTASGHLLPPLTVPRSFQADPLSDYPVVPFQFITDI